MRYNRLLCYIILGIWTLSLLQFTMVLTATKARRDQVGLPAARHDPHEPPTDTCCNPELYGIMTSIMLQDLPFLCVRVTLIFYYHVVSYTNMFFTSKNTLVIVLLIYRLIVVHSEARKRRRKYMETVCVTSPLNSKSNGHHKTDRALKQGKKSKSVPTALHLTTETKENNTIPRKQKKKGQRQECLKTSPTDPGLPTISNSVSCTNMYGIDNGRSNKSMTSLDRPKSASSLEKHRI